MDYLYSYYYGTQSTAETEPKEITAINTILFDRSAWVDDEVKLLVQEFETKRGITDNACLDYCQELLMNVNQEIANSAAIIDQSEVKKHLDICINEMTVRISREAEMDIKREKLVEKKALEIAALKEQMVKQEEEYRKKFDEEVEERIRRNNRRYLFDT